MQALGLFFASVPDPRAGNARHDLSELLFIAFAAVLCGAESCADMAEFGCAKAAALRQVLRLGHGIPSHDTFSRVFRLLWRNVPPVRSMVRVFSRVSGRI
jgi:hypothetical protein